MTQLLDASGTLWLDQDAMQVREKLRNLLRTWEDIHGLPRSFQTSAERGRERGGRSEYQPAHHNRSWGTQT